MRGYDALSWAEGRGIQNLEIEPEENDVNDLIASQQLDLQNRLSDHPPTAATGPIYEQVREEAKAFGNWIIENVPAGRHQSLALTAVQEAMMWAIAAVACDTKPEETS